MSSCRQRLLTLICIGLAKWKLDRFVAAEAGSDGGIMITTPVKFRGTRLELNAVTTAGGSVIVEMRDLQGRLLTKSQPVSGDDLRRRVQWDGDASLQAHTGQPVVLRFALRNARLFAFAFRE